MQENTERESERCVRRREPGTHEVHGVRRPRGAVRVSPNIARLFRAASYSEQIHATNHLKALGVGKTAENLNAALGGETFEIASMYPEYIKVAEADGEKRALGSMHDAMEAEKVHAGLYARAKDAVVSGGDVTTLADLRLPGVRIHDGRRSARALPGLQYAQQQIRDVLGTRFSAVETGLGGSQRGTSSVSARAEPERDVLTQDVAAVDETRLRAGV